MTRLPGVNKDGVQDERVRRILDAQASRWGTALIPFEASGLIDAKL
jgi:hypothetical protein